MGCKDFKFVKFSSTILVNLSEQKIFLQQNSIHLLTSTKDKLKKVSFFWLIQCSSITKQFFVLTKAVRHEISGELMTNNEVKSAGTLVYRYVHLPKSRQTQSH